MATRYTYAEGKCRAKQWRCLGTNCRKMFRTEQNALKHERANRGRDGDHRIHSAVACHKCQTFFPRSVALKAHVRAHERRDNYLSDGGFFSDASNSSMEDNISIVSLMPTKATGQGEMTTKAQQQNMDQSASADKRNNEQDKANKGHEKSYRFHSPLVCPMCPSSFFSSAGLKAHKKICKGVPQGGIKTEAAPTMKSNRKSSVNKRSDLVPAQDANTSARTSFTKAKCIYNSLDCLVCL